MSDTPTPQEQLKFLQFSQADGPQTKKPCPGCGSADAWTRRRADRVCRRCQDLLTEALRARIEAERPVDDIPVRIHAPSFFEGRHTSGTFETGIRYRLERIFHRLLKLCSQPHPGDVLSWEQENATPVVPPKKEGRALRDLHSVSLRLMRPDLAEAFGALDQVIREALLDTDEVSREYGTNLLTQLARGEVTVDQFNEASTGGRE